MEHTAKSAADQVNRHREDGEEAIKRTSKVVPIHSGENHESVQVASDTKQEKEKSEASDEGKAKYQP